MKGKQIDINSYRKLKWEDIKDDVIDLANHRNITKSKLTALFSMKPQGRDESGEFIIKPSKYLVTDYFDLPAGILVNQKEPIKDTTWGSFIFNSLCLANAFKDKIPYINEELNDAGFGMVNKIVAKKIGAEEINIQEFGTFASATTWLGYQTELFMPGPSLTLIVPNKRVMETKKKLLKEHPEFTTGESVNAVTAGKYHDEVEVPLLDIAKEELAKDPSGRIYNLKKPGLDNNYKNSEITNGPLPDTLHQGNFYIVPNSFIDGTERSSYAALANKALMGSVSRSVMTQRGGEYSKYIAIMMQAITLGPKDSDCGTTSYVEVDVTDDNKGIFEYEYGVINGKLVELTADILAKLVGKHIKIRSPIFCKMKGCICNRCMGNRPYRFGIKNYGMVASIPSERVKNASMKRIHNMVMKTIQPPIEDFFSFY